MGVGHIYGWTFHQMLHIPRWSHREVWSAQSAIRRVAFLHRDRFVPRESALWAVGLACQVARLREERSDLRGGEDPISLWGDMSYTLERGGRSLIL
jgi:hypothetical protein